jgi:hypothetical protein
MDYGNGVNLVPGFVSFDDSMELMGWIDNNTNKFMRYEFANNPQRYALRFGKDQVFWNNSPWEIKGVDDIRPTIERYMKKVTDFAKQHYQYPTDLYVNSFWLAKQLPGAWVEAHNDCDSAHNPQFRFSIICYLNANKDGGELDFPQLNISLKPPAGSMAIFPAQGEEYVHEVKAISQDRYTMLFWLTDDPAYEVPFHSDVCQLEQSYEQHSLPQNDDRKNISSK